MSKSDILHLPYESSFIPEILTEEHYKGHEERNFLPETKEFDQYNLDWIRLMLKKKSAGPTVGTPSSESLQMLFMATYEEMNNTNSR